MNCVQLKSNLTKHRLTKAKMKSTRARNKQDKENKRTMIMDTALEMFLNQSGKLPNSTEISTACNMTKGNLYTYFKSKEELYFAILTNQFELWFNRVHTLVDYSFELETRLFEDFYHNELLVGLYSLYYSDLKHKLKSSHRKALEDLISYNLKKLTLPISKQNQRSQNEIRVLLYSSISLIIGAYHFQYEFDDEFDVIKPEDIYLPRLKVMWSL